MKDSEKEKLRDVLEGDKVRNPQERLGRGGVGTGEVQRKEGSVLTRLLRSQLSKGRGAKQPKKTQPRKSQWI